ncbi:heparinase II/III family protein [Novosphingobium tardum]|uniref:Heparinase II/III family protein n=1 Tax=Novosphingobium tardum TaxID=1538021 RepID=A0ABV8RL11_9SPHN
MILDRLDQTFPRFAFARRLPPRRIATRIVRRIEQATGIAGRAAPPPALRLRRAAELPAPAFAPRSIAASSGPDGWHFTFLGTSRSFGPDIAWHPDDPALGQLWLMNLHYMEFLEVLAPDCGLAAILSWIAANPAGAKGAHRAGWNAYALSLRVVCWMQWLSRHGETVCPSDLCRIELSLSAQLGWLARFPETDLGGNHLVKNIKALLWGAACFEGPVAIRWQNRATGILRAELRRQVLSDGVHFERSPSYHNQVAADLIECCSVLPAAERQEFAPLVSRMIAVAGALTHPDGRPAQFNDAGLSMAYAAGKLAASWPYPVPALSSGCVLPEGGFGALLSPGFSTFIKFGEIGAEALPAHAHGDIGSIELSFGLDRLVVDQGVYEYVEGSRRDASRAAQSHNVTSPDNEPMADFFGAFRCGWRPVPCVEQAHANGSGLNVTVSHDGFRGAETGHCNRVRRTLRATPETVLIEDSLSRAPNVPWASRFLLHPAWACSHEDSRLVIGKGRVRLVCEADLAGEVEDAWWWPDMGIALPTRRIVFRWPAGHQSLTIRFAAV